MGGHCIGVDPYYLTYKAQQIGYNPQVILSGRRINDSMAVHVATKTVQLMIKAGKTPQNARVLVMGATFKEDVSDIRNSKVADIVSSLRDFSVSVDIVDPHADSHELEEEYGFTLSAEPKGPYDAIIVAVSHGEYKSLTADYFQALMGEQPVLVDLKSLYGFKSEFNYWSF